MLVLRRVFTSRGVNNRRPIYEDAPTGTIPAGHGHPWEQSLQQSSSDHRQYSLPIMSTRPSLYELLRCTLHLSALTGGTSTSYGSLRAAPPRPPGAGRTPTDTTIFPSGEHPYNPNGGAAASSAAASSPLAKRRKTDEGSLDSEMLGDSALLGAGARAGPAKRRRNDDDESSSVLGAAGGSVLRGDPAREELLRFASIGMHLVNLSKAKPGEIGKIAANWDVMGNGGPLGGGGEVEALHPAGGGSSNAAGAVGVAKSSSSGAVVESKRQRKDQSSPDSPRGLVGGSASSAASDGGHPVDSLPSPRRFLNNQRLPSEHLERAERLWFQASARRPSDGEDDHFSAGQADFPPPGHQLHHDPRSPPPHPSPRRKAENEERHALREETDRLKLCLEKRDAALKQNQEALRSTYKLSCIEEKTRRHAKLLDDTIRLGERRTLSAVIQQKGSKDDKDWKPGKEFEVVWDARKLRSRYFYTPRRFTAGNVWGIFHGRGGTGLIVIGEFL